MTWPNDLKTRCCHYSGIPLDRLHWIHTGWCYHPVVFQCQSRTHQLRNCNTLDDHWSHQYIGMPLELHWLMLAPVVFQWPFNINLHDLNTLEDHWKHIGNTLETHRLPTILSSVTFKCTLGSKFEAHWIATVSGYGLGSNIAMNKNMQPINSQYCSLVLSSCRYTWKAISSFWHLFVYDIEHIDGLVQDYNNFIANALEFKLVLSNCNTAFKWKLCFQIY